MLNTIMPDKTLISISYGEEAAVETDKTKRAELYHKIQETARDVPYLPIAYPKAVIAVDKSLMD